MTSEQPFKIAVSDDSLTLLKRKLDDTRLPDEVNAAGWAYGVPLADIKRLVSRWRDGYDWRTHEHELNALPMFTRAVAVEGFGELSVQYVHQRSAAKGAIPLLFVHGWPGSFLEVTKILPLLTAVSADHPSFHVVAPSLPGFAWSEGVLEKGFRAEHYAELFNKLMISLGYSEYVTQGGDWGHLLTLTAASKYGPKHIKASHSNMPICDPPSFRENPITLLKYLISSFTARERQFAAHTENFFKDGRGYSAEQSTKPQTLGFSLADSPVGLLAWIYEKLSHVDRRVPVDRRRSAHVGVDLLVLARWARSVRPDLLRVRACGKWDQIPQNIRPGRSVLLPQGTHAITQSVRPYYAVYLGLMARESSWLRAQGKIVFESEHEVGGHFAAYEQPEALVMDLRKMFGKSGPAAGVVPGYTGY
ncbi:alpha/beta-hydrolase [Lactarius hengduanensis]|nr:alpha/beta-hydrolase [Lactarius hengduanensis]